MERVESDASGALSLWRSELARMRLRLASCRLLHSQIARGGLYILSLHARRDLSPSSPDGGHVRAVEAHFRASLAAGGFRLLRSETVRHAKRVIVELNAHHSQRLHEMQDITILPRPRGEALISTLVPRAWRNSCSSDAICSLVVRFCLPGPGSTS